ncbi:MAG: hypothetical protein ACLUUO_02280 [Sellimonas intestinalis]
MPRGNLDIERQQEKSAAFCDFDQAGHPAGIFGYYVKRRSRLDGS